MFKLISSMILLSLVSVNSFASCESDVTQLKGFAQLSTDTKALAQALAYLKDQGAITDVIGGVELGKSRGFPPCLNISALANFSDIGYGTLKIKTATGEEKELTWNANHFETMTRDKWLLGSTEKVSNGHDGFVHQFKKLGINVQNPVAKDTAPKIEEKVTINAGSCKVCLAKGKNKDGDIMHLVCEEQNCDTYEHCYNDPTIFKQTDYTNKSKTPTDFNDTTLFLPSQDEKKFNNKKASEFESIGWRYQNNNVNLISSNACGVTKICWAPISAIDVGVKKNVSNPDKKYLQKWNELGTQIAACKTLKDGTCPSPAQCLEKPYAYQIEDVQGNAGRFNADTYKSREEIKAQGFK